MKKLLTVLAIFITTSSFAEITQKNLTCYRPETLNKRMEIVVSDMKVQEIKYVGPYNINGPEQMVKLDNKFQISHGNQYMNFQRVTLVQNRLGIFLSAYQDIELPKKGSLFDRYVTFICE